MRYPLRHGGMLVQTRSHCARSSPSALTLVDNVYLSGSVQCIMLTSSQSQRPVRACAL